jgi:predicted lipoprotein with Yx(FWY)xxD motif
MVAIGTRRGGLRALVMAATIVVACIGVASGGAAGSSVKATVAVSKTSTLGSILVSSSGKTLYRFLADHGKTSACSGSCATYWPPLTVAKTAKPVAGAGITASKLGTMKRSDGTIQVTYNGYPLYLYAGDAKAGQVAGQGVDKKWYVLAPSGATIKTSVTAATQSATSTTGSAGSSSSSGSSTGSTSSGGSSGYAY